MTSLGSRIKELRLRAGLTVRALAERAGTSAGYVSRVEVRDEIPAPETLCQLASALGIEPEALLDLGTKQRVETTRNEIERRNDRALRLFRKQK